MGATLPDVLGHGLLAETIPLPDDADGPVVATLVGRPAGPGARGAVLYVHGYNDYFFQLELADRIESAGFAFYAIDLRRYGRSLRPGQQLTFVRDLDVYFEELDAAVARIRERDGHRRLALLGHSTGGLVTALYASARQGRGWIDALALNSPFLDFGGPWWEELLVERVFAAVGRIDPWRVLRASTDPFYAWSLHRGYGKGGEWEYDEAWKLPGTLPLFAGWVAAIRAGHERVERGLSIACPVLLMASAASGGGTTWDASWMRTDTVLDVADMVRLAPQLGERVELWQVDGGMHDLVLSAPPVREAVYARLLSWLGGLA